MILCLAIALYDVDGPVRCANEDRIRIAGIGAIELNGRRRRGQPGVAGDPYRQRRAMAAMMGAEIADDDRRRGGYLWFTRPVRLRCDPVDTKYGRINAWCRLDDGRDLGCAAIRAGLAARWPAFDPRRRLVACKRSS